MLTKQQKSQQSQRRSNIPADLLIVHRFFSWFFSSFFVVFIQLFLFFCCKSGCVRTSIIILYWRYFGAHDEENVKDEKYFMFFYVCANSLHSTYGHHVHSYMVLIAFCFPLFVKTYYSKISFRMAFFLIFEQKKYLRH